MQLLLVTNCTASKTAKPLEGLTAAALKRATLPELAKEWRRRVATATQRFAARALYSGRAFGLVARTADAAGAELYIISAGMGLIPGDARIPPYSLTISPGSPDFILDRAAQKSRPSTNQWWDAIRHRNPHRSLSSLVKRHPNALIVVAVTKSYADLISHELCELDEQSMRRVRLVGIRDCSDLLLPVEMCRMPYDNRLNDPRLGLKGTEFDFAARAARHFVELVGRDRRMASIEEHARRVRLSLGPFAVPVQAERTRLSDDHLVRRITAFKQQGLSKTAALRTLRRIDQVSCEQLRFSRTWQSTDE